jgi:chromosome segregation ATPase
LLILIPTLVTSLGALAMAILTYRSTRHNTDRTADQQERAAVMTGYESLCENLREMIRVNNEEIARLRAELGELRCRLDAEREAGSREREALVERIGELETLNGRLERQLNQLRNETQGRI